MVLEHVALAFKTFVSAMIGEKPLWVSKHEVKIQYQIEQLTLEEKKIEQEQLIKKLKMALVLSFFPLR